MRILKYAAKQELTGTDVMMNIMNLIHRIKSNLRFFTWGNLQSTDSSKEFTIRKSLF